MSSKITKSWMVKRAIARGWMVWAQACVLLLFYLSFGSCRAWHNADPKTHIIATQFQNQAAGFNRVGSGYQHATETSLVARAQQFIQDNVRISVSPEFPTNHQYSGNMPVHQANFARELANSSEQYIAWFFDQQIMAGMMCQDQVLRLYKLYSNPNFLAYIKRFSGYEDHILSVHARLIDPARNRKKVFEEMGLKESIGMFNLFARCAQEVKDRRAAQEHERALRAQAARLQQEELLRNSRKVEGEYQRCVMSFFPARPENTIEGHPQKN